MGFALPLFGWKKPDPPPPTTNEGAISDALNEMLQARMDMLRAVLRARVAFLRATAASADSKAVRDDCTSRASELDFVLGHEVLK